MAGTELQGSCIVVTRPAHQAGGICERLQSLGAGVIRFPVMEITGPRNPAALQRQLLRIADYEMAIFISANAVDYAMQYLPEKDKLPASLQAAAVGNATAKALQQQGRKVDLVPDAGYNSEALLALPALNQVAGKRILIFRGEGGRELLAQTLLARGAVVDYAECYRRVVPHVDTSEIVDRLQRKVIDLIIVTSNEGLSNLVSMVGHAARDELLNTLLLVMSKRAIELARAIGFKQIPLLSTSADDNAVFDCIRDWYRRRRTSGGFS